MQGAQLMSENIKMQGTQLQPIKFNPISPSGKRGHLYKGASMLQLSSKIPRQQALEDAMVLRSIPYDAKISKLMTLKQDSAKVVTFRSDEDPALSIRANSEPLPMRPAVRLKTVYAATSVSYNRLDTLQWCHNGHDGVSNHQPYDCLINRLFRRRSKTTSKLRFTGLRARNLPVIGEFPAQRASNAENVSIWWRHHEYLWTDLHIEVRTIWMTFSKEFSKGKVCVFWYTFLWNVFLCIQSTEISIGLGTDLATNTPSH